MSSLFTQSWGNGAMAKGDRFRKAKDREASLSYSSRATAGKLTFLLLSALFGVTAPAVAQDRVLYAFTNWRIEFVEENNSVVLVGLATGVTSGYLKYQCWIGEPGQSIFFLIPFDHTIAGNDFVRVNYWPDRGEMGEGFLGVYERVILFSVFNPGEPAANPDDQLGVRFLGEMMVASLRSAELTFSVGVPAANPPFVYIFDAQEMHISLPVFDDLCSGNRLVPPP